MFTIVALVLLVLALLAAFPTTDIGRRLRSALVEQPARRLNRIKPGQTLFYAAMALTGLALFGLLEVEGLRVFSMMAPELILWFGMFDVALFLDVAMIAAALGATSRIRMARTALARAFRLIWTPAVSRPTPRARATGRPHPARQDKPSTDPDPAGLAFA